MFDCDGFAGLDKYFVKAFEFFFSFEHRWIWIADIQLTHLIAVCFAGICDVVGHFHTVYFQVAVFKSSIRQSIAKREEHVFVCAVKISVTYVYRLSVFDVFRSHGEVFADDVVFFFYRICLGEFSAWVYFAEYDVVKSFSARFAGEVCIKHSAHFVYPRHDDGRAAKEYDYCIWIYRGHYLNEVAVALRD